MAHDKSKMNALSESMRTIEKLSTDGFSKDEIYGIIEDAIGGTIHCKGDYKVMVKEFEFNSCPIWIDMLCSIAKTKFKESLNFDEAIKTTAELVQKYGVRL